MSDEDADTAKRLAQLEDALLRLSRREREILVAYRVAGLSCAEIAKRTGYSKKQVERLFVRALRTFGHNLRHPARRRWRRWWR